MLHFGSIHIHNMPSCHDIAGLSEIELKHDGILHGRNTYEVKHMFGLVRARWASVRIGHAETTSDEVWLSPAQALSLLTWLEQERTTLEQIIKEQDV